MNPRHVMGAGKPRHDAVPPDSPVEPGDIIAAKYRVDSVIAVGGMGIVLSAQHLQLHQEVAIKVLLPTELSEEPHAATRFLREARAAAGIKSDHVVRIYDVDTLPNELPYMVMERLNGCDLRALLRERGPLPIADVVEYVTQACDAIGEAHRMGIVHRDLKPSNLFLVHKNDGTPLVKVLDFGISKAAQHTAALEGTLTTSRTLIGSPMYMSPEQIRDPKAVDARSDIWSLGIILHQLLSGKPAFTADSLPGVCAAIAADPPASTRERRPDVPDALERVIQKCLEKRPDARFQSVEALCAALAPFGRRGAPASVRDLAFAPTERPEPAESSVDAPTISYGRLLRDEAAPASRSLSDAPLAATQHGDSRRRLRWAIPALVIALGAVAAAVIALRPRAQPEPGAAPAARPASFVLRVESEPPGAEVFDGDRLLGTSPVEIRLENAELERAAKRFTLRMQGRLAYVVEQGPSAADTTVRGRLAPVPEPTASASAPVSASASASGPEPARARPGSTRRPVPRPEASARPATTGTDIRLER